MEQTKKLSFIESVTNTFIGFVITLLISPAIYWLCDVNITYTKMTLTTLLFTIVSILRNYVIRRWFNNLKR